MSSVSAQSAPEASDTDGDARMHTAAECRLTVEHWLLSTLPESGRANARDEWETQHVAMLPLGTLFSAVRIPAALVQAVAASTVPEDIDGVLDEALSGGPVICDLRGRRYYALVPASMPKAWRDAAEDWRPANVEVLGRGTYLGVPRLDADEAYRGIDSYWSVPMPSAAVLCTALSVARLIAAGLHALAKTTEPDAPALAELATPALTTVTGLPRRGSW